MGVIPCHFNRNMKFFASLLLDGCVAGGKRLAAFISNPQAIAYDVTILLAAVCPQAPDPDFCLENLPDFFETIALMVFPIHCSYICSDLDECPQPTPTYPGAPTYPTYSGAPREGVTSF